MYVLRGQAGARLAPTALPKLGSSGEAGAASSSRRLVAVQGGAGRGGAVAVAPLCGISPEFSLSDPPTRVALVPSPLFLSPCWGCSSERSNWYSHCRNVLLLVFESPACEETASPLSLLAPPPAWRPAHSCYTPVIKRHITAEIWPETLRGPDSRERP